MDMPSIVSMNHPTLGLALVVLVDRLSGEFLTLCNTTEGLRGTDEVNFTGLQHLQGIVAEGVRDEINTKDATEGTLKNDLVL